MSTSDGPIQFDQIDANLDPDNRALVQYWQSLGGGSVPAKSAFDPAAVKHILPHVVIYERRTRENFVFRLVGTAVVERLGLELTGRDLAELFFHAERSEALRDLNTVLDRSLGQYLRVSDRFVSGREAIVEIVRLPLTDHDGENRFIVACTKEMNTTTLRNPQDEPVLIAEKKVSKFFSDSRYAA